MKHIDIRHHYIREPVENDVLDIFHIPGEDNPADLFTKPLPLIKIERFRSKVGLTNKYPTESVGE